MRNLRALSNVLLAAATLGACGGSGTAPTPEATTSPSVGSDVTTDRGDVTTYRGDAARTGAMTGPGPAAGSPVAWQFHADAPISSSPAVAGGSVYLLSNDGVLRALDLENGVATWTVQLGATTGSASPLVVDGSIVIGDQSGTVHALDPATGAEDWSRKLDGAVYGAAAAVGDVVLTATKAGTAYALDARTGAVTWQTALPGGVTRSVTASADTMFVGAGGILVALRLSDGSIMWQSSVATSGDCGTPTVANGMVFDATGIDGDDPTAKGVAALDAATGAIRWRYASPTQKQAYTPAVSDGHAYVVAEDETVVALDASTGSVIWTVQTGAPNEALAALAEGVLYIPTNGRTLVALDAATGATRWTASIVGVPYAAVVAHGFAFVPTNTGALFAIGRAAR